MRTKYNNCIFLGRYRSGYNGAVLKTVVRKRTVGSNPTLPANWFAVVAQSVEQGTENPRVPGSIPGRSTILHERNLTAR